MMSGDLSTVFFSDDLIIPYPRPVFKPFSQMSEFRTIFGQKNAAQFRRVLIGKYFEALPSRAENDVFHCVECDVRFARDA